MTFSSPSFLKSEMSGVPGISGHCFPYYKLDDTLAVTVSRKLGEICLDNDY